MSYRCNPCSSRTLGQYGFTLPGSGSPFPTGPGLPTQFPSGSSSSMSFLPEGYSWADVLQLAPDVVSAWNEVTGGDSGGSSCWSGYNNRPFTEPCPDTPDYDWVARAVERMPDADIRKLVSYLVGANYGKGPKTRDQLARRECLPFWVKAILGGKGCVASTYPEAPSWFKEKVAQYGAPQSLEDLIPGAAATAKKATKLLPLLAAGVALWAIPRHLGG